MVFDSFKGFGKLGVFGSGARGATVDYKTPKEVGTPDRTVATLIVASDGSGDYTKIQPAIDELPSGGGVIYIKEGTYTLTENITLKDKVSLVGSGYGTHITSPENSSVVPSIFDASNCTQVLIDKIRFSSTSAGAKPKCILFNSSDDSSVSSCWMSNFLYGVSLVDSDDCLIHHNIISSSAGSSFGIHATGCSKLSISNNNVSNTPTGIYVSGNNILVSDNIAKSCSSNGINGYLCDDSIFSSNVVSDAGGAAIYIAGTSANKTDRVSIIGNLCSSSTSQAAIYLVKVRYSIVSNNTLTANYAGIGLYESAETNLISSNICFGNTSYDLYVDEETAPSNNVFLSNYAESTNQVLDNGFFSVHHNTNTSTSTTIEINGYFLWVDATGDLRIKSSIPTSDTTGTVVGSQS